MKRYLKIILIVGAICLTLFVSLAFLVRSIANQRSCEWANIDNVELHAHVNIPPIVDSNCNYDELTNSKQVYFVFNKEKVNADIYIDSNNLNALENLDNIDLNRFLNTQSLNSNMKFYYKEREHKGEKSFVLFNKSTQELWATIEYRD